MVATNLFGEQGSSAAASLEKLGLSSYEARAYLALLAHGPTSGYRLSKLSGIPRSKIYETLERLIDRGVVLSSRGEPAEYAAIAGEELVARLRREMDRSISSLEGAIADLPFAGRAESVWSLRGRSNVMVRAGHMVSGATDRIYLATWAGLLPEIGRPLEEAAGRGRRVVVVSCGEAYLEGVQVYRHGFEEQVCAACSPSLHLVVDGSEALAGDMEPADRCEAVWTRNPGLVLAIEEYIRHEVYINKITQRLGPLASEELRSAIAQGLAEMPYRCRG